MVPFRVQLFNIHFVVKILKKPVLVATLKLFEHKEICENNRYEAMPCDLLNVFAFVKDDVRGEVEC